MGILDKLSDALARLKRNESLLDKVVNGGIDAFISTDGGIVPSLSAVMHRLGEYPPTGAWTAGTLYRRKDLVTVGPVTYVCLLQHVSGGFADDLVANKWAVHQGLTAERLGQYDGSALIGHRAPGTGAVTRTLAAKTGEVVSVKDFGAKGDNSADDAPAFQAAIDAMAEGGGGTVYVPRGTYRLDSPVVVKSGVRLVGAGQQMITYNGDTIQGACLLHINHTGDAFRLQIRSGVERLSMYWPGQNKTSSPVAMGWAFTPDNADIGLVQCVVGDVFMVNPYRGINLSRGGQTDIYRVQGEPIFVGVFVDNMLDVCRISDVHFWPFWTQGGTGPDLQGYILQNCVAFDLCRCDNLQMHNVFAYGCKHLLRLRDNGNGAPWAQISSYCADSCWQPVQVDACAQVIMTNGELGGNNGNFGAAAIQTGEGSSFKSFSVSGLHVANCMYAASIRSAVGVYRLSGVTSDQSGGSATLDRCILVESNFVNVSVSGLPVSRISGASNTAVDGVPLPSLASDATPAGFSAPHSWGTNARVTAITGGSRFNLVGGVTSVSSPLSPGLLAERGPWLLEFSLQASVLGVLGNVQFYLRLGNGSLQDDVLFNSGLNRVFFNIPRTFRIPFVIPDGTSELQIVFGGATTQYAIDMTNIKIWRPNNVTQSMIDAIVASQPNTARLRVGVSVVSGARVFMDAGSAPTAGTYIRSDRSVNAVPSVGTTKGFVCTVAGTPGTWVSEGNL